MSLLDQPPDASASPETPPRLIDRPVVLVGLMGAGKSAVGRRLAALLQLPFLDLDAEAERVTGLAVASIFEQFGEKAFRETEARVLRAALDPPLKVVATGGGAFIGFDNRQQILTRGISVFLRASLDILLARTSRSNRRPLLNVADPAAVLVRLMEERYPLYAEADVIVDTDQRGPDVTARRVHDALVSHCQDLKR